MFILRQFRKSKPVLPSCTSRLPCWGSHTIRNSEIYSKVLFVIFLLLLQSNIFITYTRGKSLWESWATTFLPDWPLPLIYFWFISNFLCTRSNYMARVKSMQVLPCSFCLRLTAILNLCLVYFKITWALAILLEHMHKINRTKIKGSGQSGRKLVTHNSKSDLPL